jgi:hypothetical protein
VVVEQVRYLERHQMEEAAHLDQVVVEHLIIAQVVPVVLALVDKDFLEAHGLHTVELVETHTVLVAAAAVALVAIMHCLLKAMAVLELLTQSVVEANFMLEAVAVAMLITQLAALLVLLHLAAD